jgi:hypothetical protein
LNVFAAVIALFVLAATDTQAADDDDNPAAPTTAPSTQPTFTDYKQIIADLNSDDEKTRQTASLRLGSMGGDALPFVQKALEDNDAPPEIQIRLKRALPALRARFRRESLVGERKAFMKNAFAEAYRKEGADSRWDKPAKEVIDRFFEEKYRTDANRDAMIAQFMEAYNAGCRNKLVMLCMGCALGSSTHLVPHETHLGSWSFDLLMYAATDAPPLVRVFLCERAAAGSVPDLQKLWPLGLNAAKQLMADPHAPPSIGDEFAGMLWKALRDSRAWNAGDAATDCYRAYLAIEPADRPVRHMILADRAITLAWKARGGGTARTVSPEGWKNFNDNLKEAKEHLEAAYKLDPLDARIGTLMITVCMGLNEPRDVMEQWYQRTIKADPDCYEVASRKLYYLFPRWHGTHEDMLAFGQECVATENWRGGIPFILVQAHNAISRETTDEKAYFLRPEVWSDIKRTFEGYLVNAPQDIDKRSEYARFATRAEQWDDANEQFKILKDTANYSYFGGKGTYDYLRRKAARLAKPENP